MDLTPIDKRILGNMSTKTHIHLELLAKKVDLAPSVISGHLLFLELCGHIRQLPGKGFIKREE